MGIVTALMRCEEGVVVKGPLREADLVLLREQVFFIGGGTCAGKTTLAHARAREIGVRVFSADDGHGVYALAAGRDGDVPLRSDGAVDFERMWLRPSDEQLAEMLGFYRDVFPYVLADLIAFVRDEVSHDDVLACAAEDDVFARMDDRSAFTAISADCCELASDKAVFADADSDSVRYDARANPLASIDADSACAQVLAYVRACASDFSPIDAVPFTPAVIAEGIAFLPSLLHGVGIPSDHCVFLTAESSIHAERYAKRDWAHLMLEGCNDKVRAFDLWMQRDELFAAAVRAECAELGYPHILIE